VLCFGYTAAVCCSQVCDSRELVSSAALAATLNSRGAFLSGSSAEHGILVKMLALIIISHWFKRKPAGNTLLYHG